MTPYYTDEAVTLHHGDALDVLRDLAPGSVDCCVTSPPYYGLRDYGTNGQYGLEASPAEYVERMVAVFAEARRVLADDGTLWLNLGDSYVSVPGSQKQGQSGEFVSRTVAQVRDTKAAAGNTALRPPSVEGIGPKNLLGIPWRVAFALQDGGWILRNAVIWHKPNAMPASVQDRLNTVYEHVFLFSKSRRYHFDLDAIRDPIRYDPDKPYPPIGGTSRAGVNPTQVGNRPMPARNRYTDDVAPDQRISRSRPLSEVFRSFDEVKGRNPGDVWTIPTQPFAEAHFACMPPALAERCVKAGCKPGGTVLDPFSGSGTTGMAATKLGRRYVGIDLNEDYLDLSLRTRLSQIALLDGEAS